MGLLGISEAEPDPPQETAGSESAVGFCEADEHFLVRALTNSEAIFVDAILFFFFIEELCGCINVVKCRDRKGEETSSKL